MLTAPVKKTLPLDNLSPASLIMVQGIFSSGTLPAITNIEFEKLCKELGFTHYREGTNFKVADDNGVLLTKYHPKHKRIADVDPGALRNFAIALAGLGYITRAIADEYNLEKFAYFLEQANSRTQILSGLGLGRKSDDLKESGPAQSGTAASIPNQARHHLTVLNPRHEHNAECPTIPLGYRLDAIDLANIAVPSTRKEIERDIALLLACLIVFPMKDDENHVDYWRATKAMSEEIAQLMTKASRPLTVWDLAIADKICGFDKDHHDAHAKDYLAVPYVRELTMADLRKKAIKLVPEIAADSPLELVYDRCLSVLQEKLKSLLTACGIYQDKEKIPAGLPPAALRNKPPQLNSPKTQRIRAKDIVPLERLWIYSPLSGIFSTQGVQGNIAAGDDLAHYPFSLAARTQQPDDSEPQTLGLVTAGTRLSPDFVEKFILNTKSDQQIRMACVSIFFAAEAMAREGFGIFSNCDCAGSSQDILMAYKLVSYDPAQHGPWIDYVLSPLDQNICLLDIIHRFRGSMLAGAVLNSNYQITNLASLDPELCSGIIRKAHYLRLDRFLTTFVEDPRATELAPVVSTRSVKEWSIPKGYKIPRCILRGTLSNQANEGYFIDLNEMIDCFLKAEPPKYAKAMGQDILTPFEFQLGLLAFAVRLTESLNGIPKNLSVPEYFEMEFDRDYDYAQIKAGIKKHIPVADPERLTHILERVTDSLHKTHAKRAKEMQRAR